MAPADELRAMEERGQVLLRYTDAAGRERDDANPNGSTGAIAGVANESFNVFGLMPHPEHAVEAALGGEDGLKIFRSIVMSVERTSVATPTVASSRSSARSIDMTAVSTIETPVALAGEPAVDLEQARAHGLTDDEYRAVERWLGRTPTFTELGVFSVMWSEHCSYKSSRRHLRMMPNKGPRVVGGPG